MVSRLSKFYKKQWLFKYKNENFDEIVKLIFNKMKYDFIELTIWTFEVDLIKEIDYKLLANNQKFSTLLLTKNSSIEFINSNIYDEIRLYKIDIYCSNEKFFRIESDNYGEYTSITMDKTIDEERLFKLLDNIFTKN